MTTNTPGGSGNKPKETFSVQRRRRTAPEPGGRERAAAPVRRKENSGAPPPGGSAGGSSSGGGGYRPRPVLAGGRGGKPSLLLMGLIVVLFLCFGASRLFWGGGNNQGAAPVAKATPVKKATATPTDAAADGAAGAAESSSAEPNTPLVPPVADSGSASAGAPGQTWTVMLYQDADDKILEKDIYIDLNEVEKVGSSDRVQIVSQLDRYRGGYTGDGDWTETRRYHVTQDSDLQRIRSTQVENLGEVNMSDGEALADFATWAIETYPADKYVLILSDHGMGWPGGWSDPAPGGTGDRGNPLSQVLKDQLYLHELDGALQAIRDRTGLDKFEIVGMDACLMAHLEVFGALAPHARYAVASQETEPALGWAYTGFLQALKENPDMSGADLSRTIVDTYIDEDQRIVDEKERAELLNRGSPLGSLLGGPSARDVAEQMSRNVTLTAADLAAMPALMEAVNGLAYALQSGSQKAVAQARTYAQSFTSVFGKDVPASYIDLGNFVELLATSARQRELTAATDQVKAALEAAVLGEKHGPNKPGASGISIYFPNSQLYGSPIVGPKGYTFVAERFADESLWDEFLAYHYAGRGFEPATRSAAVPAGDELTRAPGFGQIRVSPVTASAKEAAPGKPIRLSVDIQGDNVGHVKFFTGYYDPASASIFVADTDYLESPNTREVGGVYYPDWGESGDFRVEFEWEPLMFAIDDGKHSVTVALEPERYGAAPEDAVYTVDGLYTYADGGEERTARLYFRDGLLRQVFGFTGAESAGAPREIIPAPGDRFTVLETWLEPGQNGEPATPVTQTGGTLTFGAEMFRWRELDAAPGQYVVGFIVEDLDGNQRPAYTTVTVR